jgi:hypothetical protein
MNNSWKHFRGETKALSSRLFTSRPSAPLCLKAARVLTFPLKFTEFFLPYSFAEEEH